MFKLLVLTLLSTLIYVVGTISYTFNDENNPVQNFQTSYGWSGIERVDNIFAVIKPRHLTKRAKNFPSKLNERFNNIKFSGDEKGHLIGPQFSGPDEWYNLSPQNIRVNRNAELDSVTPGWFRTECEVAKFLADREQNYVTWDVHMEYAGESNRPYVYLLRVKFYKGDVEVNESSTSNSNPFVNNDKIYTCKGCSSSKCVCSCGPSFNEWRLFFNNI